MRDRGVYRDDAKSCGVLLYVKSCVKSTVLRYVMLESLETEANHYITLKIMYSSYILNHIIIFIFDPQN